MCFLTDDDDDVYDNNNIDPSNPSSVTSNSKRSGSKRWQFHNHHTWIIPRRPLLLVLAMTIFFVALGVLFMAIGGAIGNIGLKVVGGLLFGFGLVGLIVCTLIFAYAYFFYGTKDQSSQTTEIPWSEDLNADHPGYAYVGRPSALKSPDSTLKRNGTLGVKKVTMAPELGPYGEIQASNANNNVMNANTLNTLNTAPLHRLPSPGSVSSSRSSTMPRTGYVDGNTIGTGGMKITPIDPNQSFPSPASSISYGGSAGQYYSTGGGGSLASGSTDTYAHPRSIQLSYDASNSGSQYSTLRSIPVTHIGASSHRQKTYSDEAEYATINKGANKTGSTLVRVEHLPSHPGSVSSSQSQGLVQHVQLARESTPTQRLIRRKEDDEYMDYDNTVERTPMISAANLQHNNSNVSYHEKQMQYQQRPPQQQPDLYAPRQINTHSLQRQYAPNPIFAQQQQQQDQQMHQYKMQYEQEKKQQQQQFQSELSKSSNTSSARNSMMEEVPEPQPLVYPSARRPMTFEQVSSSKISVYDNVLANNLREKDELEG